MKDFVARSHSSLLPSCAYDSKSRRTCRNSSTHRDDLSRQRSHTNVPHTNVARRLAWPNDCEWLSRGGCRSTSFPRWRQTLSRITPTDLSASHQPIFPHHANRFFRITPTDLSACFVHPSTEQAIGLDLTLTRTPKHIPCGVMGGLSPRTTARHPG